MDPAEFFPHVCAETFENVDDVINVLVAPVLEGFFGEGGVLFGDILKRGPTLVTESDAGGAGILRVGCAGDEATFFHTGNLPGDDRLAEVENGGDVINADTAVCIDVVSIGADVAVRSGNLAFLVGTGVEVFFQFEVPEDAKFRVAKA